MKLPAFQFYPGDWRKDPNLCRCSHAAKGVEETVTCNGKDGQCNGKNDQCNGGVTVDRDIAESESDSEPFLNTIAPATPSQEKGSNLLENEETGGNTLFSQFDGLHDTFPVLAKTGAFPAKETANAGHPAGSTKAKRKKHERNALLDALVVLDGTSIELKRLLKHK